MHRITRTIRWINLKHLPSSWRVAEAGSVARASEQMRLAPQTINGRLGLLADALRAPLSGKRGRNLELTDLSRSIDS